MMKVDSFKKTVANKATPIDFTIPKDQKILRFRTNPKTGDLIANLKLDARSIPVVIGKTSLVEGEKESQEFYEIISYKAYEKVIFVEKAVQKQKTAEIRFFSFDGTRVVSSNEFFPEALSFEITIGNYKKTVRTGGYGAESPASVYNLLKSRFSKEISISPAVKLELQNLSTHYGYEWYENVPALEVPEVLANLKDV